MVFLPPAAFSLRGWLHLWSSPRRRRHSCAVASCPDLIVCSNAASAVSLPPRAPMVRGPSPPFASCFAGGAPSMTVLRASPPIAPFSPLSSAAFSPRPPTPSQGPGVCFVCAAPLLCCGAVLVSSLCRDYYSYSRLLLQAVFAINDLALSTVWSWLNVPP